MNPPPRGNAVPDAGRTRETHAGTRVLWLFWGIYAWLAFLACVCGALLGVLAVPGLARRRRWVSLFSRLPFRLAGVPVTLRGAEHLPAAPSIVVANHASYLDGILLQGLLPSRFSYVIKGEMQRVPVAHFLLKRIGARFVDRSAGASRDARTLLKAAESGESLVFFPEGTFVPRPGLGRFRVGAFAAALKSRMPIVPLVIRGNRALFPSGAILPRRFPLDIDILEPLPPADYADSKALAAAARQRILEVLGEPDLAAE